MLSEILLSLPWKFPLGYDKSLRVPGVQDSYYTNPESHDVEDTLSPIEELLGTNTLTLIFLLQQLMRYIHQI